MARHITKPSSILLKKVNTLKETKRHMQAVKDDSLVVKGQGTRTQERIDRQRKEIMAYVDKITEADTEYYSV